MLKNHEIDYRILGEEMQCVEIELDPTETAVAEAGAMMIMEEDIRKALLRAYLCYAATHSSRATYTYGLNVLYWHEYYFYF